MYNIKVGAAFGHDHAWSILKSDVSGSSPWRGKFGLFEPRIGKWVYGDRRTSDLGILDESVVTHYGELTEWALYTPAMYLDSYSIDEFEIETVPGFNANDDATVFLSLTYDGNFYSAEHTLEYGSPSGYGTRFMAYQLGYVQNWVSIKLRGASTSRMAFARAKILYG